MFLWHKMIDGSNIMIELFLNGYTIFDKIFKSRQEKGGYLYEKLYKKSDGLLPKNREYGMPGVQLYNSKQ
ncbi:hypothetical protein [Metabacillus fastidiosus]|uniref:hypothetical protein n=1 Tax=Metabacillus fastidiosus TaxID=1458 RepID=UPI002E1A2E11|nr:hypothetical protein [Metabacillus fastidiosus]MED4531339.1 hypothetical protein [Metabacillus fastidiosus]